MRVWIQFMLRRSLFLVLGAVIALLWANLSLESYEHFLHLRLFENPWFGAPYGDTRVVDLHYVVNDVLMALFFALAGKEIWEATLPGGPLRELRRAASPLLATIGGMLGPALVYLSGAALIGRLAELGQGWAIPCATDIAFSYFVARIVFGDGHPAITFLLLLAIADDALGLVILAIFYPVQPVEPLWLLLSVAAAALSLLLRSSGVKSFWIYLLVPGALSWLGFALAGLHPALALLPIVPTLPHAHTDLGLFMVQELGRRDTLTEFEHWWKNPVQLILGLFGLLNAGVVIGAIGAPTVLVLAGLLVGKPVGIIAGGWIAVRLLGFALPSGMVERDLVTVGFVASIGFTVALFVSVVAFPAGSTQDAAKTGALFSISAGLLSIAVGRMLRVRRREGAWKVAPAGY